MAFRDVVLELAPTAPVAGDFDGDGDATEAAITGGIALMLQRQINFTRATEQEPESRRIATRAAAAVRARVRASAGGPASLPSFLW